MNTQIDYSRVSCVLCLGYFDGVHLGHQALLKKAVEVAGENGWKVIVHTFLVSPKEVITGCMDLHLTEPDEKRKLLISYGADDVIFSEFDDHVRSMSGEEYLNNVLLKIVDCRHIVIGEDHRFGYMGKTGRDELGAYCAAKGIGLSVVNSIATAEGEKISSQSIRAAISDGEYKKAESLLGHDIKLLCEQFR